VRPLVIVVWVVQRTDMMVPVVAQVTYKQKGSWDSANSFSGELQS